MNMISKNWLFVNETKDIEKEDIIRFDNEGKTYCIYLLDDGFYATDGLWTHEDIHLEDGLIIDGEIECPMHQGIFDIKSGKAISPPACDDLKTYPVKVEDEKLYIQIV